MKIFTRFFTRGRLLLCVDGGDSPTLPHGSERNIFFSSHRHSITARVAESAVTSKLTVEEQSMGTLWST